MGIAGGLAFWFALLREGDRAGQETAAHALSGLCERASGREIIVQAKCIPLLVKLLREGTDGAKLGAIETLAFLSTEAHTRKAIVAAGVIALVVPLLRLEHQRTVLVALNYFIDLAVDSSPYDPGYFGMMHAAGAVQLLVQLLREGSQRTQVLVASVLAGLVMNAANKRSLIAAGVVPPLLQMFSSEGEVTPGLSVEDSAGATLLLLFVDQETHEVSEAAIAFAVSMRLLLVSENHEFKALAATTLDLLAEHGNNANANTEKEVPVAKAIPLLVKLLGDASSEAAAARTRENAAKALWTIVRCSDANRALLKAENPMKVLRLISRHSIAAGLLLAQLSEV